MKSAEKERTREAASRCRSHVTDSSRDLISKAKSFWTHQFQFDQANHCLAVQSRLRRLRRTHVASQRTRPMAPGQGRAHTESILTRNSIGLTRTVCTLTEPKLVHRRHVMLFRSLTV